MASQGILMLFFSFLCCHGLKSTEVPGDQFGKGVIHIGDIELREVSTFTRIWSPGLLPAGGATFYSPSSLPSGFFPLGSHAQPHNPNPLPRRALIARDTSHSSSPSLAAPAGFTLLFSTNSSPSAHFWLPLPPPGYTPVGHLITASPQKPLLSSIRCVRDDLLDPCQAGGGPIWSTTSSGHQFTVHLPDSLGTFLARAAPGGGGALPLACFKTNALTLAAMMPNLTQITAMIQTHAPWFHFHPDEPYLPSSVSWFFNNGALLYTNATPNSPVRIDPAGDILPQGGANDGAYWLDLPVDPSSQQFVKAGNLSSAKAYIHVKPVTSIASTDIVFWLFYPFNGAAKAKVEFVNIGLGRLGEHVGDWEHVTQRFSNFDGELKQMYFSQHSSGSWVDAADLEYDAGGSRPAAYATLHGHAFYPKAGLVLKGEVEKGIGLMDLTAKGGPAMDAADGADVVSAEYLGVEEPPWLQYMREWGPKLTYDEAKELERAMRFLPGKLKQALRNLVNKLPPELLGEEGPTGPKEKASWNGDEA
ncbi:hypothetical protein KSP39_PZI021541 [Platanthera zijinensis]|uniref:Vacuolar protein sorting-associated protein 62 n=1 Tax=Platanthera zijinensis TaxID=2320716 RepID=A0AAP0AYE3_9ASPA